MELFQVIFGKQGKRPDSLDWQEELEAQARSWHSLLLAGISVLSPFWGILDYFLVRPHWPYFVGLRLGTSAVGLLALFFQNRFELSSKFGGYLLSLSLFVSLSLMLPFAGKAFEAYSLSFTIALIGVSLFLFWEIPHSVINYMIGLGAYFIFTSALGNKSLEDSLFLGGALHISVAIFGVLIIAARVQIARREFETRRLLIQTRGNLETKTRELQKTLEEVRLRDEIIQEELKIASGIQLGTLPELPLETTFYRIAGHYEPLGEIGGDYFDVVELEDGSLAALILDVSGHGIPAAFLTIMARIAFREALNQSYEPEKWLRYLNDVAQQTISSIEYMTAQCLFLPKSFESPARLANGAHRPPLLFSAKSRQARELKTGGLILGQFKDQDFKAMTYEFQFQKGDRLCLLTDGFEESRNPLGRPWGIDALLASFQKNHHPSLQAHKNRFLKDWRNFQKDQPLQDDCALLLIERLPNP